MTAGKLDHSLGERRAPEIPVKAPAHLRSAAQFSTKIVSPASLVRKRIICQITFGKQLSGTEGVIDAFAGYRIGKASCVSQESPACSTSLPCVERGTCQSRN